VVEGLVKHVSFKHGVKSDGVMDDESGESTEKEYLTCVR